MIALSINCHILKTRGQGREAQQESLRTVARARHAAVMGGRLGTSKPVRNGMAPLSGNDWMIPGTASGR
jgi:hypothetical protein